MKYRLKDVCDLQMGKTPSRSNLEYWNTTDYKWISIADLTKTSKYIFETKEYLSKSAIKDSGIKVIPANTVVMSFKLSIGKTAITKDDMYSNEAIMAFKDKHVINILPEYIFYLFKYKNWEEGSNKAVMGKTLNKATLSEIEVEICSIEKQRQIVSILDKIMSSVDGRKQELQLLDELIKARFVEMFGDMVINPNKWEKALLGEICDVRDGTHDSPKYFAEGYPLVTSKNVTGGKIDFSNCSLICKADYNNINKRSKVDVGDILMPMIGTVGNPIIVDIEAKFAIKNVALIKFKEESEVINMFIKVLFESEYFDRTVISKVRGGTQRFISLGDIRKLEVCLPPIELQNQFADFVHQVDKSKVISENQLKNIAILLTICSTIYINMNGKMGRVLYDN